MNTNFSYDRMDYYSILEYLKEQAAYFSNGAWTDFSDADIGTVLLKLMAMNADTTNYQIEKGISELYLDTVIERVNAIALCKLIGYEPRHFMSAQAEITMSYAGVSDGNLKIPAFTLLSNSSGDAKYYTIEDIPVSTGINRFMVYEGKPNRIEFNYADIDEKGRLILPDYNVGTNTVRVSQSGLFLSQSENALFGEGELCFSVHLNLDNQLYIQLPTYYNSIFSNNIPIVVDYLITSGDKGGVGSEILTGTLNLENGQMVQYYNANASEGGYNPETVEEIKRSAPAFASTMNTLVTLNDFKVLSKDFEGIADVMALDYNYPESGLIQPDEGGNVNDAYKVNLYILPSVEDSIYKEEKSIVFDDMTKLTEDDFYVTDGTDYTFEYNQNTGEFYSTNHEHNTVSSAILHLKDDYKKVAIRYDVQSENDYDFLYIDYLGQTILSVSGETSGTIELYDVSSEYGISLSYLKDSSESRLADTAKVTIYGYKEETSEYDIEYLEEIEKYVDDVKKKKPAGIKINYLDVEYIRPHLTAKVYMDKDDLRFVSASSAIIAHLEQAYSRENRSIGQPMFQSHISKEISSNFDYIKYLEILDLEGSVDGAIRPDNTQYVELLGKNMTIKVVPYEES